MTLEQIQAITERLAREQLATISATVDREALWPEENLRALQKAGLGGLVVPTSAGGLGHGLQAVALACETLARECASTAICFGMHCVGAAVIAARPTKAQTQSYLEPIARGEHLTTLALSEPGTGVHFYVPQAKLEATSEGFSLTGIKTFVTNGGHADSYVVSATSNSVEGVGGFSCVVLRGRSAGMRWGEEWQGLGMRGNSARTVTLERASIHKDDLLGREGDEIWYVFNVIAPYFLMAMSGTYLGVARAALQEAIAHVGQRTYGHSGRRAADATVIQHRIGTLWGEVERTRQLVFHAARSADAGSPNALVALCSAKSEVAECAVHVANEAMTLCGGIAYREGSRLHRLLRDARAAHVMAPTTDLLRTWAGRALLGLPLLSD